MTTAPASYGRRSLRRAGGPLRLALVVATIGLLAPAHAADGWAPRAAVTDAQGGLHEGAIEALAIDLRGHPRIAPGAAFALNGVVRASADLAALRFAWTQIPVGNVLPPASLAIAFEFRDGTVVEPRAGRGRAVVVGLSFQFTEDGGQPEAWAYRMGVPLQHRLGAIARLDVRAAPANGPAPFPSGTPPSDAPPVAPPPNLPQGLPWPPPALPPAVRTLEVHVEGSGMAPLDGTLSRLRLWAPNGSDLDIAAGRLVKLEGRPVAMDELAAIRFDWGDRAQGRVATATVQLKTGASIPWPAAGEALAALRLAVSVGGARPIVFTSIAGRRIANQPEINLVRFAPLTNPNEPVQPTDGLPRGVTDRPRGCACGLGATPGVTWIFLRWSDLCPDTVAFGAPTAYLPGLPKLYRAEHGAATWKFLGPSLPKGALAETALEDLALAVAQKQLYRDMVRHYKTPDAFVERPLPDGVTAAEQAARIQAMALVVLETQFGWRPELIAPMGLGYVDGDVVAGRLYDYLLTVSGPKGERPCSRIDGVGLVTPPPVPAPSALAAEPVLSAMPAAPDAPRPDPLVTPIALTWTPAPDAPPAPAPYGADMWNIMGYFGERSDLTEGGGWSVVSDEPILPVRRLPPLPPEPPTPLPYRYLDLATEHLHTYRYRVFAFDSIGRTSVRTNEAEATAFRITRPIQATRFTATPSATKKLVDVRLDLKSGADPALAMYVDRFREDAKGAEIERVRLNASTPWHPTSPTFSLADGGVEEKKTYVYVVVVAEAGAGPAVERDVGLRAAAAVPDLTPPPAIDLVSAQFEEGIPLTDAMVAALVAKHHEDQLDAKGWEEALGKARAEVDAERAELLEKTKGWDEVVVVPNAMDISGLDWLEVGLDALDAPAPDFSTAVLPLPVPAEVVFKSGKRIVGYLQAMDLEGTSLSGHLAVGKAPAPIVCDGRSIPWDETMAITLWWKTFQPKATDPFLRIAIPTIASAGGTVDMPHATTGSRSAAGLDRAYIRLLPTTPEGAALSKALTGSAAMFEWGYDVAKATVVPLEVRGVRLLGTPWRLAVPGTLAYRWANPERPRPPEGEVTRIEIDATPAPGRRATVYGSAKGVGAWTARGTVTSIAMGPAGWRPKRPPLGLDVNAPGATVPIGSKRYRLDDLVRVDVEWATAAVEAVTPPPGGWPRVPVRATLRFHREPELREADIPTFSEADIKGKALGILETARYAPYMKDIRAAREGVILYWLYPDATKVDDLAGFNVYRTTKKAAGKSDFTRVNADPIPYAAPLPTLKVSPPGWPPADEGDRKVCSFEDRLLGGAESVFFYTVTAVDTAGHESDPFPKTGGLKVDFQDFVGPPAPVLVDVGVQRTGEPPSFGGVTIRWLPPQYDYALLLFRHREGTPDADDVKIGAFPPSVTSTLDVNAAPPAPKPPFVPGARYTYTLRGLSGMLGRAGLSRTVTIRPEDVPPGKGTLSAVAEGEGVRLTWSVPTTLVGVAGYVIERRRGDETVFRQRTERLTDTTFLDTRVRPDTDYVYRLVMVDKSEIAWSGLFPLGSVRTAK